MYLVDFAGYFRFSELLNIRRSDIIFYKKYLKIFIEKVKQINIVKGHGSLSQKPVEKPALYLY